MGVIADMVLAVTVVTFTAGAIPEFQLRIGYISTTADGAFVGIGGFCGSGRCLVRAGRGKGNDLGLSLFTLFLTLKEPSGICLPGNRDEVQYILTEEQEVVGKGNKGEKIDGKKRKGHAENVQKSHYQVE